MDAYLSSLTNSGKQFHEGTLASWEDAMDGISIAPADPSAIHNFIHKQAISSHSDEPA